MKKGQTTMEFVILMTFMMIVFTSIFLVIQTKTISINNQVAERQALQLSNLVKNEVLMADSVLSGYVREFWIPDFLNGVTYKIEIADESELLINLQEKSFVAFLTTNVSGQVVKGYNLIMKDDSGISIAEGRLSDFLS